AAAGGRRTELPRARPRRPRPAARAGANTVRAGTGRPRRRCVADPQRRRAERPGPAAVPRARLPAVRPAARLPVDAGVTHDLTVAPPTPVVPPTPPAKSSADGPFAPGPLAPPPRTAYSMTALPVGLCFPGVPACR